MGLALLKLLFVFLKANELLDTAKKATDKYEKERTLQEATRVCFKYNLFCAID